MEVPREPCELRLTPPRAPSILFASGSEILMGYFKVCIPAPHKIHREVTTMEFFARKSELLDELDLLQGAVEKKSTVPILSHFLLDAADFKLQIAATDLELAARSSCTAKVKAPGRATVPADAWRKSFDRSRTEKSTSSSWKTAGSRSPANGPHSS